LRRSPFDAADREDGRVSDRERDVLATLQDKLGIPAADALRLERAAARAADLQQRGSETA
jgi:hypothetical protein